MGKCIQKIINPKTQSYINLKELIFSGDFSWFWSPVSTFIEHDKSQYTNIGFYNHCFLLRAENNKLKIPKINSTHLEQVVFVLMEILNANGIEINCFLRISANCVHPHPSRKTIKTVPHLDHEYEHKNLIAYLTNAGGKLFVESETHDPEEDDVVIFGGNFHHMETPKNDRRIVLVTTFF